MLSDYTDRINKYQKQEYEAFLKQKKVLDAWQFLHSSLLYFNYALITQRLFEDASAKCTEEMRALESGESILGRTKASWEWGTPGMLFRIHRKLRHLFLEKL